MNRRTLVAGTAALAVIAFGGGAFLFTRSDKPSSVIVQREDSPLIRAHSPVLGPMNAPVTIVEVFDPSCETCRAFYPVVKKIMDSFPGKVRVVLRYAAFHQGSDEAIAILETARLQGVFVPVLEALLAAQPIWASHDRPDINSAWSAAGRAGLDVVRARGEIRAPSILAVLKQDAADISALGVRQTPTFFVNGKPLQKFGPQELYSLVKSEVEAL